MRQQSFANDQARGAASFALGGLGQAFSQRQQVNDQAFRQQQADQQNQFRQNEADQQGQQQQQQLAAQLERARIGADAGIQRADLQGQYGLDREGFRQGAMDDRATDANSLRLVLKTMGIDANYATNEQRQAAAQILQQHKFENQQQLQDQNWQNRFQLQDQGEVFQAGQNDLNRQQRGAQFDARQRQGTNGPSDLSMRRENRLDYNTNTGIVNRQLAAVRSELADIEKRYIDPLAGGWREGTPPDLINRHSMLQQQRQTLADQLRKLGPMPNVGAVYGQSQPPAQQPQQPQYDVSQGGQAPAEDPNFNPNLPDAGMPVANQIPDLQPGQSFQMNGKTYVVREWVGPDGTFVVESQ